MGKIRSVSTRPLTEKVAEMSGAGFSELVNDLIELRYGDSKFLREEEARTYARLKEIRKLTLEAEDREKRREEALKAPETLKWLKEAKEATGKSLGFFEAKHKVFCKKFTPITRMEFRELLERA